MIDQESPHQYIETFRRHYGIPEQELRTFMFDLIDMSLEDEIANSVDRAQVVGMTITKLGMYH